MVESRPEFRYRVCGFGSHIEQKTVEFTEKLDDMQLCSWCGVLPLKVYVLPCFHIICPECFEATNQAANLMCCNDVRDFTVEILFLDSVLRKKQVRCVNVDSGCNYIGSLADLDDHLRNSCDLYLKKCSKCEESVAYKDFIKHFMTCEGVEGVLLRAPDAQSLLEDMGNARKELEQALASTSANVRDAVSLLTEQLERLQSELTASSQGLVDAVTLNDCNQ